MERDNPAVAAPLLESTPEPFGGSGVDIRLALSWRDGEWWAVVEGRGRREVLRSLDAVIAYLGQLSGAGVVASRRGLR
jgi:hypothetical protein